MHPLLDRFEKGFTIFVLMYFTSALTCESLFLSPDPKAIASLEVNPFDPIFSKVQLVIYLVTIAFVLLRWKSSLITALSQPLILVIVGFMLISFLWSALPDESFRKGLNAVATSLFGVYMAARFTLREQIKYLAIALSLTAVFCLLFTVAMPGSAIEIGANAGAWRGPLTQKNLLARLMVLTIVVNLLAAWQAKSWQWLPWAGCALGSALLILSGSKTGLLVLVVMLVLIPLYQAMRLKDTVMIPILIAGILIGGSIGTFLIGNWEQLLLSLGRDPSLSGRTDLWVGAIGKIAEHPWLGYGFRGFWAADSGAPDIWKVVGYKPPHAHNGYINTALDLGMVGLMLFVLNLFVSYVKSIGWLRLQKGVVGLFPVLYVTFMFMYNHSENTIIEHNSIFWSTFISVSLSLF
jgi:exopolysaccharide production protein ExoQ